MYTDKINPDHPEGRLLVSGRGFQLKDPSLPTSPAPLGEKAASMFRHMEEKGFEAGTQKRMRKAYEAITRAGADRDASRYNKVLRELPGEGKFLSWWLLYDFYDMLPDGSRVNRCSTYYKLSPYYQGLIDKCLRAGLDAGLRPLTASVEGSMAAPFLLYLQENGVKDMGGLREGLVRDFTRSGRCRPMALYRISLFLRRYAERELDADVLPVLHYFPKERLERRIYPAFTHGDRERLEAFILSEGCPLSKRDRAVVALLLYTGMRGCDVRDLRLADIDWAGSAIRFRQGKTLREVALPLRPVVGNLIHDYVTSERPRCGREECFVSAAPRSGRHGRVGIAHVVNRAYDLCGIRQDGARKGPHLLRHSLADELVNGGSDVTVVSKTLGHASPDTSLGYMSSNIGMLRSCALSIEPYPVNHELYRHE